MAKISFDEARKSIVVNGETKENKFRAMVNFVFGSDRGLQTNIGNNSDGFKVEFMVADEYLQVEDCLHMTTGDNESCSVFIFEEEYWLVVRNYCNKYSHPANVWYQA